MHTYGHTVQPNLNLTRVCRHTRVLTRLTHAKLKKLACARTVARDFDVRTRDSKHTRHTRDARHELALGLPHCTCGVTTGTVAVDNEIYATALQLIGFFICWKEYRLKVLLKRCDHIEYSRISSCR